MLVPVLVVAAESEPATALTICTPGAKMSTQLPLRACSHAKTHGEGLSHLDKSLQVLCPDQGQPASASSGFHMPTYDNPIDMQAQE